MNLGDRVQMNLGDRIQMNLGYRVQMNLGYIPVARGGSRGSVEPPFRVTGSKYFSHLHI